MTFKVKPKKDKTISYCWTCYGTGKSLRSTTTLDDRGKCNSVGTPLEYNCLFCDGKGYLESKGEK